MRFRARRGASATIRVAGRGWWVVGPCPRPGSGEAHASGVRAARARGPRALTEQRCSMGPFFYVKKRGRSWTPARSSGRPPSYGTSRHSPMSLPPEFRSSGEQRRLMASCENFRDAPESAHGLRPQSKTLGSARWNERVAHHPRRALASVGAPRRAGAFRTAAPPPAPPQRHVSSPLPPPS